MQRPTYDIFLSHTMVDSGVALVVKAAFEEAGLSVFAFVEHPSAIDINAAFREAIAECSAFVVLLTRSSLHSPSIAFEIGAAWSWNKPVFVLLDGPGADEIPSLLKDARVFRVGEIQHVIEQVKESANPLTPAEQTLIRDLYEEHGVPADQLAVEPFTLGEITRKFNKTTRTGRTPERLLQELLRQRKQGKLPRLRRATVHGGIPDTD